MYQWDKKDPVLKTWMKAFPGTVKPKSAISDDLMDHLRYPQDLFKVQRELLTRYHVTSPSQFYSGSERWQIPDDPTHKGNAVPPYYLSMKMPGQKAQTFSLTTTFNPNKRETLGRLHGDRRRCAASDQYGKIRMLRLPPNTTVSGPSQVQSKFNSDPDDRRVDQPPQTGRLGDRVRQSADRATGGRPAVCGAGLRPRCRHQLPADAEGSGHLRRADRLREHSRQGAGQGLRHQGQTPATAARERARASDGDEASRTRRNASVEEALKDAQKAYDAGQKALEKGDWQAYGKAQKDLEEALKDASEADKGGPARTDSPGGSPGL